LEEQIADLQNKLHEQHNQYTNTKTTSDEYRTRLTELESSVNSLQMNLTATLATRDQLNSDRLAVKANANRKPFTRTFIFIFKLF
jgi:hypothetical protein